MWETVALRQLSVWPLTSKFAYSGRSASIDGRLHDCEDQTLQSGGRENLTPPTVLIGRIRRIVIAGYHLPDLQTSLNA